MKAIHKLKVLLMPMAVIVSLSLAFVVVTGLPGQAVAGGDARSVVVMDAAQHVGISAQEDGIIIDHTAVDADVIPQVWLDEARVLDTFFTHKSIGNNILAGVAALETGDPGRYSINVAYGTGSGSGITHYQVGSNQDPQSKIDGFEGLIRGGPVRDAAFMKFCVSDLPPWASASPEAVWASYRDMMAGLQADYADTVFVWWTAPLTTASDDRGNAEKVVYNGLVRSYVEENGGVLFDIADIESHDPSGNAVVGPTGQEAMYDGYSDDGAHLNEVGSQRVARGMWWLLARIAGWPGPTHKTYLPVLLK